MATRVQPREESVPGVRVFRSFEDAEASWREFERWGEYHAFQRFDWLRIWFEELGDGVEPAIVEVADARGHPALLLPLGITRRSGARVLTWLGAGPSDYHGPLLAWGFDPAEWDPETMWDAVARALPPFDSIHLEQQPALIGETPNPCLTEGAKPHIPTMSATTESWETRIPGRRRKDTRRRLRRLSERGEVRFVVAQDPDEAEAFTEVMMRQKARQHRETGHWDVFGHEGQRAFYLRAAREGVCSGLVHVSTLTCDGTPIAVEWNALSSGRCYGLLPSMEGGEWAQYAPGRLILERVLDWCRDQGIHTYDFAIGDEPYKREWCDREMLTYTQVGPRTLRGHLYAHPRTLNRIVRNEIKTRPRLHTFVQRLRGGRD